MDPTTERTKLVLALGFHLTIIVYVIFVFVMSRQSGWTVGWRLNDEYQTLFYALTLMSISMVPIVSILPRLMGLAPSGDESPVSGTYSEITHPDEQKTPPKSMNLFVVQMALAETIAINGLVLAILNRSFIIIVPFALFSLILQLSVSPLKNKLFSTQ
jgi:hypothetical protein